LRIKAITGVRNDVKTQRAPR